MQYVKLRWARSGLLPLALTLALGIYAIAFVQVDSRAQGSTPETSEETALRAVVENFFAAYGKKDLARLMALWSDQAPNLPVYKQSLQRQFTSEDLSFGPPLLSRIKVENEKARLWATMVLHSIDLESRRQSEQRQAYILEFVKEHGEWKVWRCASEAEDLAERLVKAESRAAQAKLLTEEKELVTAELGQALLEQGRRVYGQGSRKRAIEVYELALEIAQQLDDQGLVAGAWRGIGSVHLGQGDYPQALEQYHKSLKISEEISDRIGVARTLTGIGDTHHSQGNYARALEQYHKSLKISEEIGDRFGMALALNNIGNTHDSQGDYARALEHHQKSLKLSEEMGEQVLFAFTTRHIGYILQSQGNYTQALERYQKSLKIFTAFDAKIQIAVTLNFIGLVRNLQGDYTQGMEQLQKSLELKQELGDKIDIAGELYNIGVAYRSQGDYPQALEHYRKSLQFSEEAGDRIGAARALNNIGEAHGLQDDYAQALQFAERAADLATQLNLPDVLWEAHTTEGKANFALKQFSKARSSLDQAISIIEMLRTQVAGGEQEQQRFFKSRISPYYEMVKLLIAQNQPDEALTYAERAKARVLLNVLSGERGGITRAMTGQEQEQERELNDQVSSLNSQIYREKFSSQPDQDRLAQLGAQLERSRLDLEDFQLKLYAAHPELKTRRGETSPLRIEQVDALLPNSSSALLEFVVADDKTYLFMLTKSATVKVQVYPLEIKQQELADRVESFRRMLSTADNRFSRSAHSLYDLLLKPAAAQLEGKTRLLIVPDGPLWELPFQALQTPRGRYLIDDHTISYAPSLTVLRELINARRSQATEPNNAPSLLAFGNPALGAQPSTRVNAAPMDGRLDPLPEAERQVRTLGRIYGPKHSKIYVRSEAREERFKSEAKDFQILHLATHGMLNDRNPMYSYLLLAQTGEGSGEDGLLEARELMKLELNADLAILSACETARGQISRGEGVIGMTWALFVAGATTTVVSQWKVQSNSTAELMVEFHRRLKSKANGSARRNSVAETLRAASLKLKGDSRYQHPFHWAGFIVVGAGY